MNRLIKAIIIYGVLQTGTLFFTAPFISEAAEYPRNLVIAFMELPILILGFFCVRKIWRNSTFVAALVLLTLTTSTLLWSEDVFWLGIMKVLAIATVVAWAAIVATYPEAIKVIDGVTRTFVFLFMAGFVALTLVGYQEFLVPNFSIALMGMFTSLVVARRHEVLKSRLGASVIDWIYYLICLVLILQSTFRAAAIAAAVGFLVAAWRGNAAVRLTAATLAVFICVFAYTVVESSAVDPLNVDRSDLVGRYALLSDDRLSGRLDLWGPVLTQAMAGPAWVWHGTGIGGVEREIYRLTLFWNSELGPDKVMRTHSHNLLLEILVATGLGGVLSLFWLARDTLRLLIASRDYSSIGFFLAFLIVSSANVPLYDYYGGVLFSGLMLGHIISLQKESRTRVATALALSTMSVEPLRGFNWAPGLDAGFNLKP